MNVPAAQPLADQHGRLVEQTRKWVAQTFFGTLMKQMEDSPFKSDLFSGGRGGEAFSSLYHQQLVDRMSRAAGDKLVNAIVRRIEANTAYQKQRGVPPAPPAEGGAAARDHSGHSNTRRHVPAAPRA
jgi:Rod binding domain-containing protein